MPLLVALLNAFLATGEMARHVIHGIVGCLAISVAKVPERWKHSIKQHIHVCYNKYINIFELWSLCHFQVIRLVAQLIGWPTYCHFQHELVTCWPSQIWISFIRFPIRSGKPDFFKNRSASINNVFSFKYWHLNEQLKTRVAWFTNNNY